MAKALLALALIVSTTGPVFGQAGKGSTPAVNAPAAWIAQVAKIQPGMTEEEVKKLMGEPTSAERASGGRSAFVWNDADHFAIVIFKSEKAVSRDSSELSPESS